MGERPALGVLSRSPAFAALVAARAVSLVGDGVGSLALIVYVKDREGTGTAVALLLLAASLPRLLSPLAGTLADRLDKRLVLAGGELGQGVVLVAAAVWLPPLPVLLALLVVKAAIVTIAEPATTSAVPALVADDDLLSANGLLGGLRQAGEVLGPLLGAVVIGLGGVRAGLVVDASTFLLSVPLLARVPRLPPAPGDGPATTVVGDAVAGLRHTLGQPAVRALAIGFFLVGLAAGDDVALPFLAATLGAGVRGVGVLYAAVGAGLIVGYLALSGGRLRACPAAGLMVAGCAIAALGNLATGLAPALLVAVAFQVTRGCGIALYETSLHTVLQRSVPTPLLGRVFANVYGGVNLAACLGLLVSGPLLDATSARTVLIASGAAGLVATAVHARARVEPPA